MAGTFLRGDPSGVIIAKWVANGTAGATNAQRHPIVTVSIPLVQTTAGAGSGTGNAQFVSWVNPEVTTALVYRAVVYFSTTGTGSFDIGISSDGTGSANDVIATGTMSALNTALDAQRGLTGTQGGGSAGIAAIWRLGPGGTGTNNSIVGKTTEVTSTAVGRLLITYVPLAT